jgi:hypothetical protein
MRKEILVAIIAGVFFGAILAFGIWRANSALTTEDKQSQAQNFQDSKFPETELKITLASPEDFDVITQSPTKISGITKPNIWIAISGEEEDHVLKADGEGAFEQEVELVGGINQLLVYAFDENDASIQLNLTLVFSTEFTKEADSEKVSLKD